MYMREKTIHIDVLIVSGFPSAIIDASFQR